MAVQEVYSMPHEPLVIVGDFFGMFKVAVKRQEHLDRSVKTMFALRESSPSFILAAPEEMELIAAATARITRFLDKMQRYGIRN